jgi:hypothetical protein
MRELQIGGINVGPCWFFPAATSVVFDLDESQGEMLDEMYHSTWFNQGAASSPSRRTPRSAAGWCTAASQCPTSPAARACPTARRSIGSAMTSVSSGTSGSPPSTPAAPPTRRVAAP